MLNSLLFHFKCELLKKVIHSCLGSFNNYNGGQYFAFPFISTWTSFNLNVDKDRHVLITYPPYLVHVVYEQPLFSVLKLIQVCINDFIRNFVKCFMLQNITMCRNGNFGLVFVRGEILLKYMIFVYHWNS